MASFPTYDPIEFVNGIRASATTSSRATDPAKNPFLNRAIQGQYAPGSTFKLVTAHRRARSNGLIAGNTPLSTTRHLHVIGCKDGSARRLHQAELGRGAVNGGIAAAQGPHRLERRVLLLAGRSLLARAARRTASQDRPAPSGSAPTPASRCRSRPGGFIPDPRHAQGRAIRDATRLRRGRQRRHRHRPGRRAGHAAAAGQRLRHLRQRRTVYQPNIVIKVLRLRRRASTSPSDVVRSIDPVVKGQVDLPPNVYDPILQGLMGVPPQRHRAGRVRRVRPQRLPVAGKTGTAQVDGKADTSLFVGFGPVDEARYVTAAVLEESGFGADAAAAPVVRHVFETGLRADARRRSPPVTLGRHDPMTRTSPRPAPASAPTAAAATCSAPWRHLDRVLLGLHPRHRRPRRADGLQRHPQRRGPGAPRAATTTPSWTSRSCSWSSASW